MDLVVSNQEVIFFPTQTEISQQWLMDFHEILYSQSRSPEDTS